MYNVTQEFLNAIKQNGRQFQASVTIGDVVLNDDNIVEFSLEEDVNPADSFMLGSVASNKFEATLIDITNFLVLENATITPRIALLVGDNYEEVPLGVFTVDEITKDKNTVKITCFDNMIKLEGPYFSNLTYPASINDVAQEICTKAGVELATTLPSTTINKIEGYTYREAISFIASFLGGFARFNRLGKLEIVSYTDSNFSITGDNYSKLKTAEKPFAIGRLACKAGEDVLSVGSLGNEVQFENPIMTQAQLNNIYNTLKALSYMPYDMDWQGNPALMAGDKIKIIDIKGNTYNTLLMQQKLTYKGGLSATATAKGKTERAQEFNSGGSIKNRVDKLLTEQANIKILLAESATIQDLSVLWADIENLHASKADIQDLNVTNARIGDLEVNKLDVDAANIKFTNINNALIKKADVQDLNVTNAKINTLEVNAESVNQLLAGNIGAENIQAGAIQAGSAIIADGAIGNNQVSNLSASKLSAGTIDTSIVTIKGSDGKLNITGNRLQVLDNGLERVALGDVNRDGTVYGLRVRGEDGETVLFDENGLTKEGLTDGSIDDSKVANNAHIDGSKLDIDSVVRNINYFGTENIAVTKVQVGDRTLDMELSTQNSRITDNSTSISNQATAIKALDNAIRLKVDNQTFVDYTTEINGEISTVNTNLSKNTSAIEILQKDIKLKVSEDTIRNSILNTDLQVMEDNANVLSLTNSVDGMMSVEIGGNTLYKRADGTYTSTWEEGCALESVGESEGNKIEVLSQVGGRNLLLISQLNSSFSSTILTFNSFTGRFWASRLFKSSWIYNLKPNQQYTISYKAKLISKPTTIQNEVWSGIGFRFYKAGLPSFSVGKIDSSQYESMNEGDVIEVVDTFITPEYIHELDLVLYTPQHDPDINAKIEFIDVKLEKGNKPTDWTPAPEDITNPEDFTKYKMNKINIPLEEPLRRLPNGVQDVLGTDGVVTRKIGKRAYRTGDENNSAVITDKVNTLYELETPTQEHGEPITLQSFANGSVSVDSSIVPYLRVEYPTTLGAGLKTVSEENTHIKNRVAGIDINLDGITGRVSKTETDMDNLDEDINNLSTRVSTAELKIEPDRIINTVTDSDIYKNDLNNVKDRADNAQNTANGKTSPTEVKSIIEQSANEVQTAFNGATGKFVIKNGNLQIKNINDDVVFDSDTYGNLRLAGQYDSTFTSKNGKYMRIKLGDIGGFLGEYTEKAGLQMNTKTDMNGRDILVNVGRIYANTGKGDEGLFIESDYIINFDSGSVQTANNIEGVCAKFKNGVLFEGVGGKKNMVVAPGMFTDTTNSTIQVHPESGIIKAKDFKTEHGSIVESKFFYLSPDDVCVRFADGTQIIYTKSLNDFRINNKYGPLYQNSFGWSFPMSFTEPPVVLCTEARYATGGSWASVRQVSTTAATITILDAFERPFEVDVLNLGIMAIGRWR